MLITVEVASDTHEDGFCITRKSCNLGNVDDEHDSNFLNVQIYTVPYGNFLIMIDFYLQIDT